MFILDLFFDREPANDPYIMKVVDDSLISKKLLKYDEIGKHDQICMPGYARICPDMPGYARKCPEMPGYARIFLKFF